MPLACGTCRRRTHIPPPTAAKRRRKHRRENNFLALNCIGNQLGPSGNARETNAVQPMNHRQSDQQPNSTKEIENEHAKISLRIDRRPHPGRRSSWMCDIWPRRRENHRERRSAARSTSRIGGNRRTDTGQCRVSERHGQHRVAAEYRRISCLSSSRRGEGPELGFDYEMTTLRYCKKCRSEL